MSANYVEVVSLVKSAIKADGETGNKWQKAGNEVLEFYQSAQALEETKAQFIADAILPAIEKRHAEALSKDVARKGSKEYNALPDSEKDKIELVNKAKKDARATCNTYFTRIKNYAFPPEKKESPKKSFIDKISALIEEGGKIKECNFDLVATMQFLIQAEQVAKKTSK
jgi:hypothetical protein